MSPIVLIAGVFVVGLVFMSIVIHAIANRYRQPSLDATVTVRIQSYTEDKDVDADEVIAELQRALSEVPSGSGVMTGDMLSVVRAALGGAQQEADATDEVDVWGPRGLEDVIAPLVIATIALVFAVLTGTTLINGWQSNSWPTTQATITAAGYSDSGGMYFPAPSYTYSVEGAFYTGDQYWFGPNTHSQGFSSASEAEAFYQEGDRVSVAYNPSRPQLAVIQPGLSSGALTDALIFAGSGLVALIGLVVAFIRARAANQANGVAARLVLEPIPRGEWLTWELRGRNRAVLRDPEDRPLAIIEWMLNKARVVTDRHRYHLGGRKARKRIREMEPQRRRAASLRRDRLRLRDGRRLTASEEEIAEEDSLPLAVSELGRRIKIEPEAPDDLLDILVTTNALLNFGWRFLGS